MSMDLTEAAKKACEEPTLIDALNFIAIWETERIIKQYDAYKETGVSTTGDDKKWDTCFKVCFKEVLRQWINNQTYTS